MGDIMLVKNKIFLLIIIFSLIFFSGCDKKKDYSKYNFVDEKWTRTTEHDTEFISFSKDGKFSYYCACGNPVNDSDLCDTYTYEDDKKIIKLKCSEKIKDTVTKIKLKKSTDDELILDFNGDIRKFKKNETIKKNQITYKGKKYNLIKFNKDIFNYSALNKNYDTDKVYPINHPNWNIVYYNSELFGLEEEVDEINNYYKNDKNYSWSIEFGDIEKNETKIFNIVLSELEIKELYNMTNMERKDTIYFEEIKRYANIVKTSKDGLVKASIELVYHNNYWYWHSGIIDEKTDGWPEFIFRIPESLNVKFNKLF